MEIQRKKCEPSAFPQFLEASDDHQRHTSSMLLLMEENKNLKKQRLELQFQIAHFKSLELKLLDCLSHYMNSADHHNKSTNFG